MAKNVISEVTVTLTFEHHSQFILASKNTFMSNLKKAIAGTETYTLTKVSFTIFFFFFK